MHAVAEFAMWVSAHRDGDIAVEQMMLKQEMMVGVEKIDAHV